MSQTQQHPSRIGPYPIEREVGRGGMGIVYLGRDTRLDRPVAIKVLPEALASDPERLARFEREARLLASLNHPNIAAIYGLEESEGRRYLVLEYVEGETLAQRVARGPLPVDDAIDICRQVAAALEAAHEGGVIHRDLKPGNVKLTPAGEVKVLDFGLAKGGSGSSLSDPSLSASPTMAVTAVTSAGVILGTAAYMSPEQARGRALDRRTDIWSFGCVLYECLTGRRAFDGETTSDLIAHILKEEPEWKTLPANLPARVRALLARCLVKDPRKRLRDIGEAHLVLEGGELPDTSGISTAPTAGAEAPPAPRSARIAYVLAALFALTTIALAARPFLRPPASESTLRLVLPVPPTPFPSRETIYGAFSPDGRTLISSAADSAGSFSLWIRPLDGEGRLVPGTDDGALPFWSPDGRFVVFATQSRLKKLDTRGGNPEILCPIASYGRGGSWGSRNVIVFAAGPDGPLFQVSKDGGTPQPASALDSSESGHRFPEFLPDGRHFLYASMPARGEQFSIYVGSTDDPKRREQLMVADGTPVYVEPGYLLYSRNGRVVAHRFDPNRRKLIGEPVALADEPKRPEWLGAPSVTAADRGPFAYYQHRSEPAQIAWIDRTGRNVEPLPVAPGPYEAVAISPDGERAALVRRASSSESDLWLLGLRRMTVTRFTHGPGRVDRPVWSRDGKRIAFSSDRNGRWDIYQKAVDGADAEEPVPTSTALLKYPNAWSPDGQTLLYEQLGEKTGWDVWAVSLQGDRTPRALFATPFDEQSADLSPDGRRIAYISNESGRVEVYVQDYPEPGGRQQISTSGGTLPEWRADGRELIYVSNTGGVFIEMNPAGRAVGSPRNIHPPDNIGGADIAPDFSRAIGLLRVGGSRGADDLRIVLNWRAEVERR